MKRQNPATRAAFEIILAKKTVSTETTLEHVRDRGYLKGQGIGKLENLLRPYMEKGIISADSADFRKANLSYNLGTAKWFPLSHKWLFEVLPNLPERYYEPLVRNFANIGGKVDRDTLIDDKRNREYPLNFVLLQKGYEQASWWLIVNFPKKLQGKTRLERAKEGLKILNVFSNEGPTYESTVIVHEWAFDRLFRQTIVEVFNRTNS